MGMALRRRTAICQKLPKDFEQTLLNYQRYITYPRKAENFLMGRTASADETAIYLDMPPKKNQRQVSLSRIKYVVLKFHE